MSPKAVAVLLVVCVATLAAAADLLQELHCPGDKANCKAGCTTTRRPADTCFFDPANPGGGTWDCKTLTGACFELIAYPAQSACAGSRNTTAVGSRANYCDECKGHGPNNSPSQPLQTRVCRTIPGTSTIYQVDYVDCKTLNQTAAKAVCGGCSATAATSFPLGQCVHNYEGFDWRLEFVSERCNLMPHRDYSTRNCSGLPEFQDNIVLDQCNNGWMCSCPGN
jgi:hypothetical protein